MAQHSKKSSYLLGVGVAAAVVAGVVGFLTKTRKGQQLAKKGYKEMVELGRVIADRAEHVKNLTKQKYDAMVDEVVADYEKRKKMTGQAAGELAAELKSEWNKVRRAVEKGGKKK